jgi:cytochrome c
MRRPVVLAAVTAALGALSVLPAVAAAQTGGVPPSATRFQKVTLNDRPGEPMSLAVLPDRRVLHTARTGEVRIHNPRTGLNTLAAQVPVYRHDEEGLQGIAVDPSFRDNHWVYLYYSPPLSTPVDDPSTPTVNEGDAPTTGTQAQFDRYRGALRLSRFQLVGNDLDLGSEQQILDVPSDRGICCHVGGQIDFDGRGNLFLSTGDDSNPFFSDGYIPIDERLDRNPAFDAQRTAANTNDLRGKLLRIRVNADGSYEIPSGNLFPESDDTTEQTRPEIYAMGLRNPFRFAVNRTNGHVYMGDYSPDAPTPSPLRGPAGHGRWMLIRRAGNYGWPYCVTPDLPYFEYDFDSGQSSGVAFDCSSPENDSPRNTGLRRLPPVLQPDVWYSYPEADDRLFPELLNIPSDGGDGIGPMGGPAYQFAAGNPSAVRWPSYYHGVPLFYEWTRDYVKEMRLNRPNGTALRDIRHVPIPVDNPMDMEFGPDGALYVLDYGDGFFAENPEAQLARIDFIRGNHTPVVRVASDPPSTDEAPLAGQAPLTVRFSSAGTQDPDGDRIAYAWDFNADGVTDSRERNPSFTYTENGVFDATLRVTDSTGRSAAASVVIIVGNTAPVVELTTSPAPGEPFSFGQAVSYTVTVTDDSPVDCTKVTVNYVLGHDQHGHPLSGSAGCAGTITTFVDSGHTGAGNLRAVFSAMYTDIPADPDVPPLTGDDEVVLTPTG